ncbi:MAG: hypothetical protein PWP23_918 [Candidatus Sumerlaeota bacterium]|nr:hypothetical protein [Candidatus Sumerlaeota bacterium]
MSNSFLPPSSPLYEAPDLYARAFEPPDPGQAGFFATLLGSPGGRVLSLGCGEGRLEETLARHGLRFVGIDASVAMAARAARRDPFGLYVAARMEALPLAPAGYAGALSALLSFAYLTQRAQQEAVLRWLAVALMPGAPLVLEIPLAWRPRRLQGISERHEFGGGEYAFHYFDVLEENDSGAVLATAMRIATPEAVAERHAPLMVFTPPGIRELLEAAGFEGVRFHAPYDLESGTESPPRDCLRGVVVAQRRESLQRRGKDE